MRIIQRHMWKARKPKRGYGANKPEKIVIHHSGTDADCYKGSSSVRAIQDYHMLHNGWNDIGYHYVIGTDGTVFECRPENGNGAHCPGLNSRSVGICVYGNYEKDDRLNPDMWLSLVELVCGCAIDNNIHRDNIIGHMNAKQTICPGEHLQGCIPVLRLLLDIRKRRNND